ncbi:Serine/threonine-protein kinase SKM1 [Rhizoctonia solani]|uniref:Serine/threonine-protein kinase SKM1 n=1 Tax=Rhizoctonia solani TaxID=456999 RepID=A0A0K6FM51_9AGAM|nr:Serine/threonine-protein kinase SKM1 [Rhizoctonia solani]
MATSTHPRSATKASTQSDTELDPPPKERLGTVEKRKAQTKSVSSKAAQRSQSATGGGSWAQQRHPINPPIMNDPQYQYSFNPTDTSAEAALGRPRPRNQNDQERGQSPHVSFAVVDGQQQQSLPRHYRSRRVNKYSSSRSSTIAETGRDASDSSEDDDSSVPPPLSVGFLVGGNGNGQQPYQPQPYASEYIPSGPWFPGDQNDLPRSGGAWGQIYATPGNGLGPAHVFSDSMTGYITHYQAGSSDPPLWGSQHPYGRPQPYASYSRWSVGLVGHPPFPKTTFPQSTQSLTPYPYGPIPGGEYVRAGEGTQGMWREDLGKSRPTEPLSRKDPRTNVFQGPGAIGGQDKPGNIRQEQRKREERIERSRHEEGIFPHDQDGGWQTGRQGTSEIGSTMSTTDIVAHLVKHGCKDLTDSVDLATFSEYPVSNGGFSDVYRGYLKDRTQVAIKALRVSASSLSQDPKHLKRAARELHTWSKCKHPNVLPLLGLAIFRGRIGMVSPWMKKGSLPRYLEQVPGVDRYNLCIQICDGLSYMHKIGIIHGDLKGANVLISDEGIPLLTDFGNALLAQYTLKFTQTTSTNSLTIRWAAPELIEESSEHNKATDVYALGMTIYEALTGKVPYHGRSETSTMYLVTMRKTPPERPQSMCGPHKTGDQLWNLLRCWFFEPTERPSSAEVLSVIRTITSE